MFVWLASPYIEGADLPKQECNYANDAPYFFRIPLKIKEFTLALYKSVKGSIPGQAF